MENKLFEILSLAVTYLLCLSKLNYVLFYIATREIEEFVRMVQSNFIH